MTAAEGHDLFVAVWNLCLNVYVIGLGIGLVIRLFLQAARR